MSYHPADDISGTEPCANCGHNLEDHGAPAGLCECGHDHTNTNDTTAECDQECDRHPFKQDGTDYCDWSKDGSTFRSREPR